MLCDYATAEVFKKPRDRGFVFLKKTETELKGNTLLEGTSVGFKCFNCNINVKV